MTVIETDIQSYTAFAETERSRLQRCVPKDEGYYAARLAAANTVLAALQSYKQAITQPAPSENLNWNDQ